MSEPKPPSKQSLIFLVIAIGFCCCLTLIVGAAYLFYKTDKESTVKMEGEWLDRNNRENPAVTIKDDGGDYVKLLGINIDGNENNEIYLFVENRKPFKATHSIHVTAEPIPDQEPVRTHIKTYYTLTSKDGKAGEYKITRNDRYENGQISANDEIVADIKLIKGEEAEEEFRVVKNRKEPFHVRKTRKRCNCQNHKFSPYPNMW